MDLLFERHGHLVLAVEIKAKRRIAGADLSGLRSFAQAHPTVPRVVVCEVAERHQLDDTEVVPWRAFFEAFERWF